MKHIEINIWKACNNKCRFCMSSNVWEDENELTDYKLVENEIKKYREKWYESIWFLWWDISIHPKIYNIIEIAKDNWYKEINIITNWMIFENYSKAEKLIKSWVTRVNISIHSHESKVEDYLTQIPWGLFKKIKAIDNFNELFNKWLLKSPLSINIVLNKQNYKNILKTCLYFYIKKNIKDIRINFLWNRYFYSPDDKEKLELSYTEFLPYFKKLLMYSLKSNLRITFDSIPGCIFYKLWLTNIRFIIWRFLWEEKDHIEEVVNINKKLDFNWKNQKKDELKIKFKDCEKCLYLISCQWVWKEYVKRFWSNEFKAINNYQWIIT